MKKRNLDEWLKSGDYLPPRLRDFHAQKAIFKSVEKVLGNRPLDDMVRDSWIGRHIYVIDYFLWYMARHGWTLQRSRQSIEFEDIDKRLSAELDREAAAFRMMLNNQKRQPEQAEAARREG